LAHPNTQFWWVPLNNTDISQRKDANIAMKRFAVIAIVMIASNARSNPGWQAKESSNEQPP
jgi:hypothetical protein